MGDGDLLPSCSTGYVTVSILHYHDSYHVLAVTVARVYLDCAEATHYEKLFDGLQRLILTVTGKPLAFKRFSQDGNLLCMNADMEAAQVLGAARSIRKSVDFQFSELSPDISPEDLAAYFVRLCLTHTKRFVNVPSIIT